ncbi:DUF1127 domain-containing protein [Thalassococcus sp. CAU 1522]|uniref:DUF1127 domain-containing protein n=2 Tax=Thalassococcus arenae TaxID=2851652 RepID=A0ABS6N2E3_9RHOB|nr:DUF1127 domain-containing protein [Thalassococcus arenae]MBV2358191.1 DUF1127 domain-containing protein [Thalassococcus arenae]
MANVTDSFSRTQGGLGGRFAALVVDLRARLARRRIYRETLRELNTLSERELNDLGLNRSVIRRVAWQAAYEV